MVGLIIMAICLLFIVWIVLRFAVDCFRSPYYGEWKSSRCTLEILEQITNKK